MRAAFETLSTKTQELVVVCVYTLENLMGLRADTKPVRLLSAMVDREHARRPPGVRISDDIVEAD
jgi:hypothetical protein